LWKWIRKQFYYENECEETLTEIGKTAEVDHTDLTSARTVQADIFIGAADIVGQLDD
jgi:PTS system ascorbate-specific IIB component